MLSVIETCVNGGFMCKMCKGRPRCKKICCSEEGEKVVVEMYALGISTKEIGKSLG